ncbi:MAG TPA: CBS domain-containing protein [Rhodospirillales bacterium]|nr:CBS domain-containing protein [Rhodospirillales bacterium]
MNADINEGPADRVRELVRVGDVMSPMVRMIALTASVAEALEAMRDAGVSSLVVERRDDNDEFGLIVVTDIAREVVAKDRAADRVNVYEVMSKPVLTVPVDMQSKYAVRLLVRFNLSRALVVDETRSPVGIVTLRDLVLRHTTDAAEEPR